MTKHTPATPLPELYIAEGDKALYPHLRSRPHGTDLYGDCVLARDYCGENAHEYVRRANAYPKLVEALRRCFALANEHSVNGAQTVIVCEDILRELGEAA